MQLEPELEERLLAQARAQGMPLDRYIRSVIEQAAVAEHRREIPLTDVEAALDALAEGSDRLPVLPADAYRRESIYGDDGWHS